MLLLKWTRTDSIFRSAQRWFSQVLFPVEVNQLHFWGQAGQKCLLCPNNRVLEKYLQNQLFWKRRSHKCVPLFTPLLLFLIQFLKRFTPCKSKQTLFRSFKEIMHRGGKYGSYRVRNRFLDSFTSYYEHPITLDFVMDIDENGFMTHLVGQQRWPLVSASLVCSQKEQYPLMWMGVSLQFSYVTR
jgi:hypothetical protein